MKAYTKLREKLKKKGGKERFVDYSLAMECVVSFVLFFFFCKSVEQKHLNMAYYLQTT